MDQISNVVEEEEDELTQTARQSSNAEASTSDSQVSFCSLWFNKFEVLAFSLTGSPSLCFLS